MKATDEDFVGVTIENLPQKSAMSSHWLSSTVTQSESLYRYQPISVVTAQVLANNELSDPLITRNRVGKGEVFLTTPLHMQSSSQNQILEVCTQLLDSQIARYSTVHVLGLPVEYVVNQVPGTMIVSIINNSSLDWSGKIVLDPTDVVSSVSEYVTDQSVQFSAQTIPGRVPAFGVRVFGIEYSSAASRH
jgi:hypothetical protein